MMKVEVAQQPVPEWGAHYGKAIMLHCGEVWKSGATRWPHAARWRDLSSGISRRGVRAPPGDTFRRGDTKMLNVYKVYWCYWNWGQHWYTCSSLTFAAQPATQSAYMQGCYLIPCILYKGQPAQLIPHVELCIYEKTLESHQLADLLHLNLLSPLPNFIG